MFKLHSPYGDAGDQARAIASLSEGVREGLREQTLMGVTGSGKTYTMARIIQETDRPTLVLAHNKTLAAQLYNEFRSFFPENAVEYFVSYYDYYQPEAYVPGQDLYIEKDADINDDIDKLRHSATSSLLERRDVIVVASVSCIYGLGSPSDYQNLVVSLRPGSIIERDELLRDLTDIQYDRNDMDFHRGTFRVKGDTVEVFPASTADYALRIEFYGDEIDRISEINPVTGKVIGGRTHVAIYPASHYVTSPEKLQDALTTIQQELDERLEYFNSKGMLVESQRLMQRTNYDMEMLREMGYCKGIENYTRHINHTAAGDPPYTLLDYFPEDFLMFVDESHVTLPQVRGMWGGDHSRKENLVDYGFRLPSAFDNRPLSFEEFDERINQVIYVSATPGEYETERSGNIAELIVRPTGLIDPKITVVPTKGQIEHLMGVLRTESAKGNRVLVTTLTKRMAEDLTQYLSRAGIACKYMHSDIDTLERSELIKDLRSGVFDVLIGINLLREGLDLPEVSTVAILDADKEGFLRSTTALIQTIGRAARHEQGQVIMYADTITPSMKTAIDETERRRAIQSSYNEEHGIVPRGITREIHQSLIEVLSPAEEKAQKKKEKKLPGSAPAKALDDMIADLEKQMKKAASELDFEKAAVLRDRIKNLRESAGEDR
ncbi:MAG: excinuclease ABC subunit UvrB [Eubacteriaceae bacterium]|nr:excinuclease ABC subunit UvrB [Eubacteriaceae bacterium]